MDVYLEDKSEKKPYRINEGDIIEVRIVELHKGDYSYKMASTPIIKYLEGKNREIRKEIKFKTGEIDKIKDGTKIRVKKMFEDVRLYKNIPIWQLVILDYDIVEEPDYDTKEALFNYQQSMQENKATMDLNDIVNF